MRMLTGDRPSGKLHLGHFIGSLQSRVALQDKNNLERFIIIADNQALTDDMSRSKNLKENVHQVICDYLAVGIDPAKSTIFLQSMVPEIAELSMFFMNLVTVNRLRRNPTVKAESTQKGFGENMPAGFLVYPVSQAADILVFLATQVPVGEDQVPVIEQVNEIGHTFNRTYEKEVFPHVEALLSKTTRLVGIDGQAKMSKTLNNAIYLSDDADTIAAKVRTMYTDPNHIHVKDPGKVEGNTVFTYLDAFDPETEEVAKLKEHYQRGGLGDMVLKKRLTEVLNTLLEPIRIRRSHYEHDRATTLRIAQQGTEHARSVASQTMQKVRSAMHIDYF